MEPTDPIAALDQALAGMKALTQIVRAYYLQSIDRGFNETQALQLTQAYQAQLVAGALAQRHE